MAAHLLSSEPFGEVWVVEALRSALATRSREARPKWRAPTFAARSVKPPPQPARLDVLLELGRAEAMLPVAQEFPALREALVLSTDPRQRAELALELALALFGVFRNGEARLMLDEALTRERDLDAESRTP